MSESINVLHDCNGKMMALTIPIKNNKGEATCGKCGHVIVAEWKGGRRYRCIDTSAGSLESTPRKDA